MGPSQAGFFRPRPRFDNFLIRRDWSAWKRGWRRSPKAWIFLALVFANYVLSFNHHLLPRGESRHDDFGEPENLLYYYFSFFHLILHIRIAYHAFRLARRMTDCGGIDALLVAPIPHAQIFWSLWARAIAPGLAAVLLLYLPLAFPWGWLWEVDPLDIYRNGDRAILPDEAAYDALAIVLLLLPWIANRAARLSAGSSALFILYLIQVIPACQSWLSQNLGAIWDYCFRIPRFPHPNGNARDGIVPVFISASNARFHPAITLPYFAITAAWSAGLGVYIGLRRKVGLAVSLLLLCLAGPAAEAAMLHLLTWDWSMITYKDWNFLYWMLILYASPMGILWMGLKWNLLVGLSRRPIPSE